MWPLPSIRIRLTFWYIALLALILAVFSAGIYLTLRHSLYASLDDSLETRADELLAVVELDANRPTLADSVPLNGQHEDEQFVRVFDQTGAVTFDTGAPLDLPGDHDAIRRSLAGTTITSSVDAPDGTFRTRFTPIRRDWEISGVLEVARSEDDVRDTLHTLLLILGISFPATLMLASLGGLFLASRALSPIDKLTRVAQRLSAEDLSQRLDLALPDDEVGRLARTFDDMLARLDLAFRQQRQFTADASHELRTPLTAIKGQTEVALQKDRDPDTYREVLRSVNSEVDRMIRLVGSLLTLARADARQIPIHREDVNLGRVVTDAVDQIRPEAARRRIAVTVRAGNDVRVVADQDLMLQLNLNLLDNAVKHTPASGSINVSCRHAGAYAELVVSDTGRGIPAEHLPHVFDRFYRVDKARTRAEGGAGLGLSICRWIAEAHGGSIRAESSPGAGSTFTVRLPAR